MAKHFDWGVFILKLKLTVTSRKFWALLASLVTIWTPYYLQPTPEKAVEAVRLTVGALGAFSVATAVEGIGAKQ